MVSFTTLGLVLFSLVNAAPVEERQLEEVSWQRGTEVNAPDVGVAPPNHRAGVDFEKALSDPTKQPALPVKGRCTYAYQPYQKTVQAIAAANPFVVDKNVYQGGIGDCAFGASVAAIALRGKSQILRDNLKVNGSTYEFTFFPHGEEVKVVIDDQLPADTGAAPSCAPLLGFQIAPKNDPTQIAYVPLLEKAVAKYQDARQPKDDGSTGYPAMEGIAGQHVLEMLTGGKGTRHNRVRDGLDEVMVETLGKCLTGSDPCLLSSPPVDDAYGQAHFNPVNATHWNVPKGESYNSALITKNNQTGLWQVTDYDNGGAVNSFVGGHAWAIDKERSRYDPNDLRKSVVRIVNPWGLNKNPWHELPEKNGVELSFPATVSLFRAVMTIEDIPV